MQEQSASPFAVAEAKPSIKPPCGLLGTWHQEVTAIHLPRNRKEFVRFAIDDFHARLVSRGGRGHASATERNAVAQAIIFPTEDESFSLRIPCRRARNEDGLHPYPVRRGDDKAVAGPRQDTIENGRRTAHRSPSAPIHPAASVRQTDLHGTILHGSIARLARGLGLTTQVLRGLLASWRERRDRGHQEVTEQ